MFAPSFTHKLHLTQPVPRVCQKVTLPAVLNPIRLGYSLLRDTDGGTHLVVNSSICMRLLRNTSNYAYALRKFRWSRVYCLFRKLLFGLYRLSRIIRSIPLSRLSFHCPIIPKKTKYGITPVERRPARPSSEGGQQFQRGDDQPCGPERHADPSCRWHPQGGRRGDNNR